MPSVSKVEFVETRPLYGHDGSPSAESDYVFRVGNKVVAVRVHWAAIQTLDGDQLFPDEVKHAASTLIELVAKREELTSDAVLTLDSAAMDVVAAELGWLDRFYSVSVSDYRSSVEEWHRAQAAPKSELPPISKEEKEVARKFGVSEEQYRRGRLAGLYGNRRQREKARRLGEHVQEILKELGKGYRLVAILWQGDRLRWLLRIDTPDRNVVGIPVSFELADDTIDAGILDGANQLKQIVVSGVGRGRASA